MSCCPSNMNRGIWEVPHENQLIPGKNNILMHFLGFFFKVKINCAYPFCVYTNEHSSLSWIFYSIASVRTYYIYSPDASLAFYTLSVISKVYRIFCFGNLLYHFLPELPYFSQAFSSTEELCSTNFRPS